MAAVLTLVKDGYDVWGGRTKVQVAQYALDSSYPTGGYSLPATKFGMKAIWNLIVGHCGGSASAGYQFWYDIVNSKFMVFRSAGFTPAGTLSVTSDLNLATPAFSGTGYATSGQVITTTDNQTMTLNQCAGMWFVPPSGAKPAVLILSNTAVTGAPAVLTVQGIAPTTDAGAYTIVKGTAPTLAGTAVAAGALVEVANGVSLVALTNIRLTALGR